jgi:molybdate transport system permease protein
MGLTAEEWGIVVLSLEVSLAAVLGALPVAFALAWVLARLRFPGKLLLDGLVHLPLVLPPVVIGWLLLVAFAPEGPAGRLLGLVGISVLFRWSGAAIAAAVMALPLMVRAIRLSLEAVDPRLEAAARTLGAGPWRTFRTVTLPLAAPGVLAGAVLGFARSLGEFGATITFVSNIPDETRTLPLAIYAALQLPGGDSMVWRLAALAVALSLAALVASEALTRASGNGRGSHVL